MKKAGSTIPRSRTEAATVIPDNPNWHRFKMACPYYRERWAHGEQEDESGRSVLYDVICLQNTPPETLDQQDRCMEARTLCWRLRPARRARIA